MRTQKIKSIGLFVLLIPSLAFATEVARLDRKVAGFVNHSASNSVLLISADGQSDWLNEAKLGKKQSFKIADKECAPFTQNTGSMESIGGLTLAYPFLVGVGRACYIDEVNNSIRLLSDFQERLPANSYSATYAGEDDTSTYFLINGRIFPKGTAGYLQLVTINKSSLQVSVRALLDGVPGYSGAMTSNQKEVWITSWPNNIYKIEISKLLELIHTGGQAPFLELAKVAFNDKDGIGMSLFMLENEKSLLYFNGEYESYTIDRSSGAKLVVNPTCEPIAGFQGKWITLCNETSVEIWSELE